MGTRLFVATENSVLAYLVIRCGHLSHYTMKDKQVYAGSVLQLDTRHLE
jgi:hypothetical protein